MDAWFIEGTVVLTEHASTGRLPFTRVRLALNGCSALSCPESIELRYPGAEDLWVPGFAPLAVGDEVAGILSHHVDDFVQIAVPGAWFARKMTVPEGQYAVNGDGRLVGLHDRTAADPLDHQDATAWLAYSPLDAEPAETPLATWEEVRATFASKGQRLSRARLPVSAWAVGESR